MPDPTAWLEILAWTKAIFEAIKAGADLYASYEKYKNDPETINEAKRVSVVYSTFSPEEVASIERRIKGCRDRFISQGGGEERNRCICSVLNEAMAANGGTLPEIYDWKNIYETLKCNLYIK